MSREPPHIGFLLLPGFTLTPFAALVDVLRLAADQGDRSRPMRLRWSIVAVGLDAVPSSSGVTIGPPEPLGEPSRFDYLVVCGGLLRRSHAADPVIEDYLRRADAAGATIVGLCTGVFMLAQAGLLAGRQACVSWFHLAEFRDEFPDVRADATQLYTVDGRAITCAGGTGAVDVGALIVERHVGAAAARKALHIMVIDDVRPASFPQPQPTLIEAVTDIRVRQAVLLIEQDIATPPSVAALARAVGTSRRQLERLFVAATGRSPAAFVAELRLHHADWLMRTTTRPLTEIAAACGFSDTGHLSRRYRAAFGKAPSVARLDQGRFLPGERRPYAVDNLLDEGVPTAHR